MKYEEMEPIVKLTKWQQVALALSTYLPDMVHEEVKIALRSGQAVFGCDGMEIEASHLREKTYMWRRHYEVMRRLGILEYDISPTRMLYRNAMELIGMLERHWDLVCSTAREKIAQTIDTLEWDPRADPSYQERNFDVDLIIVDLGAAKLYLSDYGTYRLLAGNGGLARYSIALFEEDKNAE
jgi:hypothetical protein